MEKQNKQIQFKYNDKESEKVLIDLMNLLKKKTIANKIKSNKLLEKINSLHDKDFLGYPPCPLSLRWFRCLYKMLYCGILKFKLKRVYK